MSKTIRELSFGPWSLDRSNIFAAPWKAQTISSRENPQLRSVKIHTANLLTFTTPLYNKSDLSPVLDACEFLSDVVSAFAQVRGNADYESSQQVVGLHVAALDIMEAVRELQIEQPTLLDNWWRQTGDEVIGQSFRVIAYILTVVWPDDSRRAFEARHSSGRRLKYFKYNSDKIPTVDSIRDIKDREFLFFYPVAANPATRKILIDKYKDQSERRQMSMKRHRLARYAYWSVVLEFSNAFRHLDEGNSALPKHFPELVHHLRILYQPLQILVSDLEKEDMGYALRLARAMGTIGSALECFDSPKDRNLEFEQLSPDERRTHYKGRNDKYEKIALNQPYQGDFFPSKALAAPSLT